MKEKEEEGRDRGGYENEKGREFSKKRGGKKRGESEGGKKKR